MIGFFFLLKLYHIKSKINALALKLMIQICFYLVLKRKNGSEKEKSSQLNMIKWLIGKMLVLGNILLAMLT